MKESAAYPKVTDWRFVKYMAVAAVGMFFMFALFSGRLGDVEDSPGTGAREETNLRGEIPDSAKLSQLIAVGLGLTDAAAKVIKDVKDEHKEQLRVKGVTKEGVDEPVTVADTSSNLIFVNGFRNHFNGIQILSEETEPEKADTKVDSMDLPPGLKLESDPSLDLSDVLIIVDPLDATKEFSEDLLQYVTTMVCVVHKGEPIAGIINQVFEDNPPVVGVMPLQPEEDGVLFSRVKKEPAAEAAHTVTISRSHTGDGGKVVQDYLSGHTAKLAGGSGYKSLLVLDGAAAAYLHVSEIKSWDVCAAQAVLKASGGGFSDIEGHALKYPMEYDSGHSQAVFRNGIIATASKKQQEFFVEKLEGALG